MQCALGTIRRHPDLLLRREPKTTALIFGSGKMVCTGAKSEVQAKMGNYAASHEEDGYDGGERKAIDKCVQEQARLAARKYARIIQKIGFQVSKD